LGEKKETLPGYRQGKVVVETSYGGQVSLQLKEGVKGDRASDKRGGMRDVGKEKQNRRIPFFNLWGGKKTKNKWRL